MSDHGYIVGIAVHFPIMLLAVAATLATAISPLLGGIFVALATTDTTVPTGYVPVALLSAAVTALSVILSGKIVVPTFAYTREKERADFWQAEALRQTLAIVERHVPALDAASHAITESNELVRHTLDILSRER